MSEFVVEAPPCCPLCGKRVCFEWGAEGEGSALHCGSVHDDPNSRCPWRQPVDVPHGAPFQVVSQVDELNSADFPWMPAALKLAAGQHNQPS